MTRQERWAKAARYWQIVPRKSYVVLLTGIFLLFVALGYVMTFFSDGWWYIRWASLSALTSGLFAIGWAHAGFRRIIWLFVLMAPIQFLVIGYLSYVMNRHTHPVTVAEVTRDNVQHRLRIEGTIMMFTIIGGYVLIVYFVRAEGLRVFGPVTEVRLAREVHQRLVPEIVQRISGYEIFGVSVPSGQVGGDLVDVIQNGKNWIAYVADVCGHGVPAGMIMAMVKSAAHSSSSQEAPLGTFLSQLNRVLKELSAPNDFVTFVCIAGGDGPEVQFSIAGHHPILHFRRRAGVIEERSVSNPPLAVFDSPDFSTASMKCDEGDILVVVTDGLTEAADKNARELGLEPLKALLLQSANVPLRTTAHSLRDAALRQGKQVDDQTVLLIRRNASRP